MIARMTGGAVRWRGGAAALALAGATLALLPPCAAAELEAVSVRLDWLFRSYHAPFFLGVEKGWYRDAGIELKIAEGRGSGSVVQLVGNQSDTFGFATADAIIRGVQNHIPVISVATIMPTNADSILVMKRTGITRPAELKGKTIATTAGGTSDLLLPAFLKSTGLAPGDVTVVPLDAALKVSALLQGKIDAMNGPVWTASDFAPAGGANTFLYADYGVRVVGYGIVTGSETLRNAPDLVRRFIAVTLRAWSYSLTHPEEALAALEKASAENAKPEVRIRNRLDLPQAFELVRPAVPGEPFGTQSEAAWEQTQRLLFEYRAIKDTLPVGAYFTNRFIE